MINEEGLRMIGLVNLNPKMGNLVGSNLMVPHVPMNQVKLVLLSVTLRPRKPVCRRKNFVQLTSRKSRQDPGQQQKCWILAKTNLRFNWTTPKKKMKEETFNEGKKTR